MVNEHSRVGVDGYNLAIPRGTGVATYARGLTHCLGELGHKLDVIYGLNIAGTADPVQQEVEFFDQLVTERPARTPKYPSVSWFRRMARAYADVKAFEIPITGRVIPDQRGARLPHYDRMLNSANLFGIASQYFHNFGRFVTLHVPNPPAVMHWTYPVPVRLAGAKNIYTIHDMVPLRLPYTTLDRKSTHYRLLKTCMVLGDHICTVSEASRKDIMDFFPTLAPEKITNTYQAVLTLNLPDDTEVAQIVRGAFGLEPGEYFLFFGSIEPKKNVGRLLQAYLSTDIAMPLVVIGARAWKSEAELRVLKDRPANDRRVRQIEYVASDVLSILIRGARAVVFPSIYEGFGLPMLEAMSIGTPVLTSREGSLAEVGGDAVLFIDAYDPRDIAAGLQRLAEDDELCAALSAKGTVRAQMFDMVHYRERIATMYARLTAGTS
jgi:glycosyltransferase involved in cell wall biosynthesis